MIQRDDYPDSVIVRIDPKVARLERLLLLLVKAELGHGGMRNEVLESIEKELERG